MRVRIRFTKLGRVCFLSHRDVARVWERAVRKASLAVAYSEGFSPRPKVHFGLALSVGHTSEAEYLDIDLRERVELDGLAAVVSPCLPPGIDVTAVSEISPSETSLQAVVDEITWQFLVGTRPEVASEAVAALMSRASVPVTVSRKGTDQEVDLRPAIGRLDVEAVGAETARLTAVLATKPKSFRPDEVLDAIDLPPCDRRVHRVEQWIIDAEGGRRPVLAAPRAVIATDVEPELHVG